MALVTFPTQTYFESVSRLQLMRSTYELRSRYTGKRQVVVLPFALWQFEGKLLPQTGLSAGRWRSFLAQLRGRANTFKLVVPGSETPLSGYAGPQGTVQTQAQPRATSVATQGWTPNATILAEGDYFTVNDELKVATIAIVANASGQATISFEPGLRKVLNVGSVVTVFNPYMLLAAQEDDAATWSLEHPVQHGITIKGVEALD
jgi:hypothetical protein